MNNKCQVFTPDEICEKMLDLATYKDNLYGKKVLENSCGDGHVLSKIVTRYILDCLKHKKNNEEIRIGLENDIYAYEIDNKHRLNCINLLNDIAYTYGINNVKWNVLKKDYLKSNSNKTYDYIIGNPPYISYKDLDEKKRKYIKNNFQTCYIGKFDYCYAFIEKSVKDLSDAGILVYIIPNSIFKNKYALQLREYIKNSVDEIYDYKNHRVFPNALTSSAIIRIDKNSKSNNIKYYDYNLKKYLILEKTILGEKWCFKEETQKANFKKIKFGELFTCSISIATLSNDVFVIKNYIEKENKIYVNGMEIEKKILRNAISPRNKNYGKKEKIIFPYKYLKNGKLYRYSEKEFKESFPLATKYLFSNINKLKKRKADKGAKWFEYGRTHALSHLNQKKLLMSTVITNKVKVYILDKFDIPYSGIYIVSNKDNLLLAKKILESDAFYQYVCNIGINASGNSLRITPRDIMNFEINLEEYEKRKI